MDRINVACVGTGYWGKNLVRNFYSLPGCALKVCCDLDAALLEKMSAQYPGIETTQDYAGVLADPSIDAVVLASPAARHFQMATMALEAGKHTYVEKPITLSAAEAARLTETAETRGLVLMVGHLMEYHPAVEMLKGLVDTGELGDIHYLYMQRLNLGIIRKDENALWSLAPHDVSIALYLLGEQPATVCAWGQSYLQENIEDVCFCNLTFPSGRMAHIHVSWLDPHKIRKMTVVGSKKMAVFDDIEATEKVRIYDKGVNGYDYNTYADALTLRVGDITIPKVSMTEPLKSECEHFLDCIRGGLTPRSDGRDGLRVVSVLEAADRSLKSGGAAVPLPEMQDWSQTAAAD
jgi:predicted dehydrogenase